MKPSLNKYVLSLNMLTFLMLSIFFLVGCVSPEDSKIYKEGRRVIYQVEYLDKTQIIICIDTIELTIPEQKGLDLRRLVTDQITNTYEYYGNCSPELTETTGIKETENRLFIHPPRMNRMVITELGAFPQIFYPAKVGSGGEGTLVIESGYGDWNGMEVKYKDSVVSIIDTTIAGILYKSLVIRKGVTINTPIGRVHTTHAFSNKYGWVLGEWEMDTSSIRLYAIKFNW